MKTSVDKKAVVAIVIVVVLLVTLVVGGLFLLNLVEFPDLRINTTNEIDSILEVEPGPLPEADPAQTIIPAVYEPYMVLTLTHSVHDALLRDDWIYFAGLQDNTILIERMHSYASTHEAVLEIPMRGRGERIVGFDMTESGTFRLLTWDSQGAGRFVYVEYDRTGNLLVEWVYSDEKFADVHLTSGVAIFFEDGSISIDVHDGETCEVLLFVLEADGSFRHGWRGPCGISAETQDGTVIFVRFNTEEPTLGLHEIDLLTGVWSERHFEAAHVLRLLYGAPASSRFDFYVEILQDDAFILHGFNWEPEEFTYLINWSEKGFRPTGRDPIVFLPDGQIIVFRSDRAEDSTNTFVLTLSY